MAKASVVVGVDLGGTWIRLQALDASGRPLRSLKQPAIALEALVPFLKRIWRRWAGRPDHLAVASKGIWTRAERAQLKKRLRTLAPRVTVLSDVEAAWLAAFDSPRLRSCEKNSFVAPADRRPGASLDGKRLGPGLRLAGPTNFSYLLPRSPDGWATEGGLPAKVSVAGGEGILIISGTGSIAFARDRDGCTRRAGGLDPLLGDEGSAFWIGRQWLRHQAVGSGLPAVLHRLRQNPFPVRRIASLAMKVFRLARRGDPDASFIVRQAQDALADLTAELAVSLHWRGTLPLSWAGSILDDPWFRSGFIKAVERHPRMARRKLLWQAPRTDAATAAARYALMNHPPLEKGGVGGFSPTVWLNGKSPSIPLFQRGK